MSYYIVMKEANIGELKNNLSYYVSIAEQGEEVEIQRRNKPVAIIIKAKNTVPNKTVLGCGKGSVVFGNTDLTEPLIPESDWQMLS